MNKRIGLSSLVVILLALGSIFPASAQNTVDPQLLTFIQTAFKNTSAATGLTVNIDAVTANLAAGQTTAMPTTTRKSSFQLNATGSGDWNVTGTQTVAPVTATAATPVATSEGTPRPPVNNNTTLEMVILDGKTYIRYTEIPPRMEVQNPPPNWTDMATLPPGTTFGGGIPAAKQIVAALALPIDAAGVTGITEKAADTIDGQAMRVFDITLDTQAVLDGGAASLLNVGFARPTGRPGANATPTASAPAATPQATAQPMTPDNTKMTLTVWIGTDNLVHRIGSVVTRSNMGANGQTTTTLTATTDFSAFNQPATITAPALTSS